MKICHFSTVHPQGDTRIFWKECVSTAAAGHEVHLVITSDSSGVHEGVHIRALSRGRYGRIGRMIVTAWRAYAVARDLNADIYHFHDPELIPFALVLKWRGCRVVYDAHEDVPRQILAKPYIHARLRRSIAAAFECFENFAARRFDAIVTATPHIRDRFLGVNPHSVDVNNFPLLREFPTSGDWGARKPQVCYVGTISTARGAASAVAAIRFTGVRLKLAGEFKEEGLETRLRAMDGWLQVDYLGFLDRESVQRLLAQSMVGLVTLLPTRAYTDSLPVKMFEYMAAGVPVIASDFPLWREIVDGSECGLCVDPQDPVAIGKAIEYVLTHPDEARRMGENGRRAVLDRYNWKHEEKKLLALYAELGGDQVSVPVGR